MSKISRNYSYYEPITFKNITKQSVEKLKYKVSVKISTAISYHWLKIEPNLSNS